MGKAMNKRVDSFFGKFRNPFELLVFYDKNFLDGVYNLYPWQIEILKKFGEDVPADDMIRMAVIAANGSGKSQFILAPCAIWMATVFEQSLSYVTSSSASQLDTQSERFMDSLIDKMNKAHREISNQDVWKAIKRQKIFLPNKSHIDLFATDEPRKAEGKHPLTPDGEFAIFVDEGKSIEPNIYGAIDRCIGATRRLDISSAGGCHGHFYDVCTKPELGWWTRKIVYTDCPHIRQTEAKQLITKHGLFDPLVRSILFSEFTSVDEATIINRDIYDRCLKLFKTDKSRINIFGNRRMGVDLSAGGDEQVGSVWEGNLQLALETCRITDTAQGAKEVIHWAEKWNIKAQDVYIEYDGFNRGIVDNIIDKGWLVNKIVSNAKADDFRRYQTRGTELWFNFKRFVEEGYAGLLPDQQLKDQFCSRYYKTSLTNGKIQLESKSEARAKGHPSPDRADATVFAWAGCPTIDSYIIEYINKRIVENVKYGRKVRASEVEEVVEEWTYGDKSFFTERPGSAKSKNINACLSEVSGEDSYLQESNFNF